MQKITISGNSLDDFNTALQVFLDTTPTVINGVITIPQLGTRITVVIIFTA